MSKRISDEVEGDQGIVAGEEMLPVAKHGHGHGHKVGRGEKESVFAEFGYMFKEMFFADDPLRLYKDQPASRRVLLGIESLFPIVNWIRDYNLSKFKGDLIAGLTIASLAIPQDLGYAKLAHLPPKNGLSVIDIDTSGLNAFEDLYKSLQKRDVQVALANPGPAVIEKFHSSKFAEMIGQGRFFLTVADAVHAFASKVEEEPYYLAP
ncbi:hypothetical protein Droror1_Dr00006957 [Drosera rotundifolia]